MQAADWELVAGFGGEPQFPTRPRRDLGAEFAARVERWDDPRVLDRCQKAAVRSRPV
jgi:hypothetical protein